MWTRRPTIIAGKAWPDDWSVLHNGIAVGRVYDGRISTGGGRWVWAVMVGKIGMGYAETLDAALEIVRNRAD